MNKESKLNLNASNYAIRHFDSNKTYNALEVHKMLCDAYIAGNNDTLDDKDEEIRKALINVFATHKDYEVFFGVSVEDIRAWLEKQEEIDKESYEIAEKEKYDFVSGQFIECRKSFNDFKEDNSYWVEYIGNDTYIGRSDNILNQKFHITPRQLFTLFTVEHCPKNDENAKIKKNLIEMLKQNYPNDKVEKYVSWIERHSENDEDKDNDDERIRKALINVFSNRERYLIDQSFGDITVSEALTWLKKQGNSVDKIKQKFHWRPSDEQITWLYRAADDASEDSRMKQVLNELLSDLKNKL